MGKNSLLGLLFSLIWCHCVTAKGNESNLGDRLIFEINHNAFTQRQMEIYLAIKQILKPRAGVFVAVNATNWQEFLRIFRDDMLVYQEARRQGHFQPPNDHIKSAMDAVEAFRKKSNLAKELQQRLQVEHRTLLRTCSDILQIEEFRRIKEKSLEKEWLNDLEQRFVVRYFKGVEEYKEIHPTLGKGASK